LIDVAPYVIHCVLSLILQVCDACQGRYAIPSGHEDHVKLHDGPIKEANIHDGTAIPCCPLCLGLLSSSRIENKAVRLVLEKPLLTSETLNHSQPAANAAAHAATGAEIVSLSLESAVWQLKNEWTFDEFTIDLSLPAAFAVREQAAKWLLSDDVYQHAPSSQIKDSLRSVLISHVERISGAVFKPCASFKIQVKCEYDKNIESEAEWLQDGVKKAKKRRKRAHRNCDVYKRPETGKEDEILGCDDVNMMFKDYSLLSSAATVFRLSEMSREEFFRRCPVPVSSLSTPCISNEATLVMKGQRSPQYIGGRYLKVQRGLPQSPWIVDGIRKGKSSVQEELAAAILPGAKADSYAFISSGREDIDVRMLGYGRPFALEVRNARVWPLPSQALPSVTFGQFIRAHSESGVYYALKSAQLTLEDVTQLKMGEENKKKSYAAVCWASNGNGVDTTGALLGFLPQGEFEIRQKTPLRVLHRRPNIVRCRMIHEISGQVLPGRPNGYFLLRLTTAAGTYVKEFINGDRGRTQPSLSDLLGCRVECVYLDVTTVHMEF
jgi:tRNA pseudouridine synthase 10